MVFYKVFFLFVKKIFLPILREVFIVIFRLKRKKKVRIEVDCIFNLLIKKRETTEQVNILHIVFNQNKIVIPFLS